MSTQTQPVSRNRHIAKERFLSDRFIDPVTMEATTVECRNRDVIFRCQTDFGMKGSIKREFTLRGTVESAERKQKLLADYQDELYELVNMVEDCAAAFRHCKEPFVMYKVLEADRPIMIKASLDEKLAKVEFYGMGINGLTIQHEYNRAASLSSFILRLEEILTPMRIQLVQLDKLPVQLIMDPPKC